MAKQTGIVKQLKKERDQVQKQLHGLNAAIAAFVGVYTGSSKPTRKPRKLSAKGLANIKAAQKKRWAKVKAKKGT